MALVACPACGKPAGLEMGRCLRCGAGFKDVPTEQLRPVTISRGRTLFAYTMMLGLPIAAILVVALWSEIGPALFGPSKEEVAAHNARVWADDKARLQKIQDEAAATAAEMKASEAHCKGKSAAQRNRDADCLRLDCPGMSYDMRALAASKKIALGMTSCLARAAWGSPSEVNRTVHAAGVHEQWVYDRYPKNEYVYVENDVVTSWQD